MTDLQRRTLLRTIGATGALVSVGTAAANGRRRQGASADDTIVETAKADGRFDTLIAAVKAADSVVLETLANDDQYTVFAPTNGAFEDFFDTVEKETSLTKGDLLSDKNNLLTETLLYHVTGGRRYAASVVNAPEIDTLLGESFAVDGTTLDGRANITTTNVEASNGVVHAIDAVLTTPTVDSLL